MVIHWTLSKETLNIFESSGKVTFIDVSKRTPQKESRAVAKIANLFFKVIDSELVENPSNYFLILV